MELDFAVVYGVSASVFVFLIGWIKSIQDRTAKECERRLSRVEAIVKIYLLDVPKSDRLKRARDYLEEADEEIFGKNLLLKDKKRHASLKRSVIRKKSANVHR